MEGKRGRMTVKDKVDLLIETQVSTTLNVVCADEIGSILERVKEILNANDHGIVFDINKIKVVGRAPRDFDSTV